MDKEQKEQENRMKRTRRRVRRRIRKRKRKWDRIEGEIREGMGRKEEIKECEE